MHLAAVLLVVAGCGDDGGSGAGGGTTSSQTAAGSTGSSTSSQTAAGSTVATTTSTTSATTTSSGGAGDGSCGSPFDISLPFEQTGVDSTGGSDDVTSTCEPIPVPETVFRIGFATEHTVTVTAAADSGDGISLEIRAEDCSGTLVGCVWQADGGIEQVLTLPAGSWVFIVQRSPAGSFDFSVTE
jgi:hypothetical protein